MPQSPRTLRFVDSYRKLNLRVTHAAKKMGVAHTNLVPVIKGRAEASVKLIERFCEEYGQSKCFIMYGHEEHIRLQKKIQALEEKVKKQQILLEEKERTIKSLMSLS